LGLGSPSQDSRTSPEFTPSAPQTKRRIGRPIFEREYRWVLRDSLTAKPQGGTKGFAVSRRPEPADAQGRHWACARLSSTELNSARKIPLDGRRRGARFTPRARRVSASDNTRKPFVFPTRYRLSRDVLHIRAARRNQPELPVKRACERASARFGSRTKSGADQCDFLGGEGAAGIPRHSDADGPCRPSSRFAVAGGWHPCTAARDRDRPETKDASPDAPRSRPSPQHRDPRLPG